MYAIRSYYEKSRLASNGAVDPYVKDEIPNFVDNQSFIDGRAIHFARHQFKLEVLNGCKTDDDALAVKTAA